MGIFFHKIYLCLFVLFIYLRKALVNIKAYNETVWSDVELEILHYSKMGKVMICGDLNGRTGSISPGNLNRISQDKVVNNQGKHLIDLCYTADLYILNGTFGDITSGNFTFYGHQGGSVVDYILSSKQIFFTSFSVSPLSQFSDNCSISFNLQTKQNISSFLLSCRYAEELALDLLSREEESGINVRCKWIEVKKRDLISLITSAEWTSMFSRYMKQLLNLPINDCIYQFQQFLINLGLQVGVLKVNQPWFDEECMSTKRKLKAALRDIHKFYSVERLKAYLVSKKYYKHLLRSKKRRTEFLFYQVTHNESERILEDT